MLRALRTYKIFDISEEKMRIFKPTSKELLGQLKVKVKEYEHRITEKERGWDWTIDAAYKALVLKSLVNAPDGGSIEFDQTDSLAWDKLVNGPMNVAGITHVEMIRKAWLAGWGYVNDLTHVKDGTDFPKLTK